MPLVSVIIPVYNVEKYLRQCLDSVTNQTLKDIEIICIDDGSTDNSLNILKEYKEKDNRIVILQQQNQYAGVARNNGLKIATGKYLSFLDSDDFFELDMLKEMYDKAEKDQSDIVICGWYNYNNKTKKIIKQWNINNNFINLSPFSPKDIANDLFTFCKPNPWTKLFRKDLFINNNLYFEDFISCNDLTCVCTALAISNKISVINKAFIYYRSNQDNNLTANRSKHLDCFINSINRLKENLLKFNLYNIYHKTFLKRSLESLKWELSKCTNNQKQEYFSLISTLLDNDIYNNLCSNLHNNISNTIKKNTIKNNKIHHKKYIYF